jgi:ABC-type bacteriocin/lantibiotic exporter with double-glycine peptidase domain
MRIVLSAYGLDISEAELRDLCDCTVFGTDALQAVVAARNLGFPGTAKHNLSLGDLLILLEETAFPIVFVNLQPIDGIDESHALVVVEFREGHLVVCDPEIGERLLDLQSFATAWALRRNLTIVIAK